jgi:hypothetical protein
MTHQDVMPVEYGFVPPNKQNMHRGADESEEAFILLAGPSLFSTLTGGNNIKIFSLLSVG